MGKSLGRATYRFEDVKCIELTQDVVKWGTVVNTVMNTLVP